MSKAPSRGFSFTAIVIVVCIMAFSAIMTKAEAADTGSETYHVAFVALE